METSDPNQRLLQAAARGDWNELVRALEAGADINTRDGNGLTPLMHEVGRGEDLDRVRCLVEHGADVNARDPVGRLVLEHLTWPPEPPEHWENEHEAWAHAEQNYIYDYLRSVGAQGNPFPQEVPSTSVEKASADPVPISSAPPADRRSGTPDYRMAGGLDWALFAAIQHGSLTDVESILATGQVCINACDEGGWTPLMRAVAGGHLEIISVLLENGADLAFRDRKGLTAMSVASPKARAVLEGYLRRE